MRKIAYLVTCFILSILVIMLSPMILLIIYKNPTNRLYKRAIEYFGIPTARRPEGVNCAWIHASSVGQARMAITLADEFLSKYENGYCVITTNTASSIKTIKGLDMTKVVHQFFPFDSMPFMLLFMLHWRPSEIMLVESELWPSLMLLGPYFGDVKVMNAQLSDKSMANWSKTLWLLKSMLERASLISAATKRDYNRYIACGLNNVIYGGSLKYKAKKLPCDEEALNSLRNMTRNRPMWLAASMHEDEYKVFIDMHIEVKKSCTDVLSVICVRHPNNVEILIDMLKKQGVKYGRYSFRDDITSEVDVYIIDTMGNLGTFYGLCKIVVMGGSFNDRGGHNMIEAMQYDCKVAIGPSIFNFSEIVDDMVHQGKLELVSDANHAAQFVLSKVVIG